MINIKCGIIYFLWDKSTVGSVQWTLGKYNQAYGLTLFESLVECFDSIMSHNALYKMHKILSGHKRKYLVCTGSF